MSENPIDWSEQHHSSTKLLVTPLTFRITPVSQIAVLSLFICATPLALSSAWLLPIYLLPILLAVWIVRNRTIIGDEQIVARAMLSKARFTWDELRSLRLDERRWVRAVLESGREVALPAVRVRDIPVLAQVSGGRLADPTTVESEAEAEENGEHAATDESSAAQESPAGPESAGTEVTHESETAESRAGSSATAATDVETTEGAATETAPSAESADVERNPGDTADEEPAERTPNSES